MENTQRVEDAARPERAPATSRTRGVPSDWFLDPADPSAGAWSEQSALEDQATAFLTAHEPEDDSAATPSAGTPSATVTALVPRPARHAGPARPATEQPTRPDWETLPGPAPEPVEGGLAWQADALCAQTDPEAFFPEKGGSTREAKRVCAACTVRAECLDYAMENDERFGIWGGLSERERHRLRRGGRG